MVFLYMAVLVPVLTDSLTKFKTYSPLFDQLLKNCFPKNRRTDRYTKSVHMISWYLIVIVKTYIKCFPFKFFSSCYNFLNWSIVDLWCCTNFCCTAKWLLNTYSYTDSLYIYIFSIMIYHRILNTGSHLSYI